MQKAYILIGGVRTLAKPLAENLVQGTAQTTRDGIANIWTSVWEYQVGGGNVIAFKSQRSGNYAFEMTLNDAATTAMSDDAEVMLVVYYPDNVTMKNIIWKGTYGTIKNGTKYDLEKMVVASHNVDVQPDEYIHLRVKQTTETLDISESTIDLGVTRWVIASN